LATLLRDELRIDVRDAAQGEPDPGELPVPMIEGALFATLRGICPDGVDLSDAERLRHAAGRSYLDLLRLRAGTLEDAPDAVVFPTGPGDVAAVLRACVDADCAVVPFGGGTSVVGGVTPLRGSHRAVIALSLRRLNRLRSVDTASLTATLEAGMTGPEIESALGARGLTLGHFPQSFEYATVGGFAATRSAGQASGGYGRFDEMVLGLRCVTPEGDLVVAPHPASAAGPSLRHLLLGSEGRIGVITEVTARVRHRPAGNRYEAWSFRSIDAGSEALAAMAQRHVAPDVARLSDAAETRVGMAMASEGGLVEAAGRGYLRARKHDGGCALILGWDSDDGAQSARRAAAHALVKRSGGISLGTGPGRRWHENRFAAPYLRDSLMDAGVLVETLETATSWSNLDTVRRAVFECLHIALTDDGIAPLVGAHISHIYPSGASLYFTVLARPGPDPAATWRSAKAAASQAILDHGGTITHHHAIGTDHRAYLAREVGAEGVSALRALASRFDPRGIMNPGKLLPD
jgi:alkyldihydroxyacetonephosphate synthase